MYKIKQIQQQDFDLIIQTIEEFWGLYFPSNVKALLYKQLLFSTTSALVFCIKAPLLIKDKLRIKCFENKYGIQLKKDKSNHLYFYIHNILYTLTSIKLEQK